MLTDSQLYRLQDVLGCLACYANDLFGVVEPEQFMNLMESNDPAQVDVIHEVLQTLWGHVDIIDTFVEKNPYDLNNADLRMALSWKDALHSMGVYAGTENGQELYLIEGRLVALEQAELHESGPCLVDITILPFENMLVEDYTSMAMDLDFAHANFPLRRDIAVARSKGIIATPEQFIPFAREINQRRHEAEMDRLMADLDRESRLHAGEDISPEGFHRGQLSGLSREERDAAIMAALPEDTREEVEQQLAEIEAAAADPRLRILRTLEECTFAYGLITIEDAYHELELLGLEGLDDQRLDSLIEEAIDARELDARLWPHNRKVYLANPSLYPEAALPAHEEAQLQEERLYLLECQEAIPRKHLYEFSKDGRVGETLFTSQAADDLVTYLNERIPDNQEDLFFANSVLDEMIFSVVEGNADTIDLMALAEELGLAGCDTDAQRLMGRLTVLRGSLPLWELNGWSFIESMEMQTGRKMFFDDRGVPLKVGRNDPCPCGSGKPYKDCHGK
ncbi:MAG: hypothetical protein HFJ66_04520 [Eggerthellaceae bacterium]|nr:hypothetical protein [Eggerthellaceae bacterium]